MNEITENKCSICGNPTTGKTGDTPICLECYTRGPSPENAPKIVNDSIKWLPIAQYDRAKHGEWVLAKGSESVPARRDGEKWVTRIGREIFPAHFRPLPSQPEKGGDEPCATPNEQPSVQLPTKAPVETSTVPSTEPPLQHVASNAAPESPNLSEQRQPPRDGWLHEVIQDVVGASPPDSGAATPLTDEQLDRMIGELKPDHFIPAFFAQDLLRQLAESRADKDTRLLLKLSAMTQRAEAAEKERDAYKRRLEVLSKTMDDIKAL